MASSVAYKYVQRLAAPACDQHLCHDAGVSWLLAMTVACWPHCAATSSLSQKLTAKNVACALKTIIFRDLGEKEVCDA